MPLSLDRFQFLRRMCLAGLLVAVSIPLLAIGSAWHHETHEAIEMAGLALIAIGILGRMWCTLYIGGRKSKEIVDVGPYSMTRNPLYLFSSVAAAGVGAQTGSLLLTVVFAAGCAGAFLIVIRREETFLRATFGAPYEAYLKRVPRFLPDPRLFRDQPQTSVTNNRLYRTLGDGLVFFAAIPALEGIEYLQHARVLHTALQLY